MDIPRVSAFSELDLLWALGMAVDFARYWQPPDDEDVLLADPEVVAALRPIADTVMTAPPSRVVGGTDRPRRAAIGPLQVVLRVLAAMDTPTARCHRRTRRVAPSRHGDGSTSSCSAAQSCQFRNFWSMVVDPGMAQQNGGNNPGPPRARGHSPRPGRGFVVERRSPRVEGCCDPISTGLRNRLTRGLGRPGRCLSARGDRFEANGLVPHHWTRWSLVHSGLVRGCHRV